MRLDFGFRHLLPRILSNQRVHMCSLAMSITLKDRNSHMSTAEHWVEATYPGDTNSSRQYNCISKPIKVQMFLGKKNKRNTELIKTT